MGNKHFKISDRLYTALILIISVLAVWIRVYRFGDVPGGFNQDGLMAAVDAKALAEYGTDRFGMRYPVHFTAWGFGQMSVLMSYMMVPLIRLFGLSVITARLPCLLASLSGLAFLYLFSRRSFGKEAALCIFFIGSVCPWHIIQSRWALDCNLFPHFLMAGMWSLYLAAEDGLSAKKKCAFLAFSMVLFALSMYCYGVSVYTVPLMLIALCILLFVRKKIQGKLIPVAVFFYLIIAWPFLLCMAINAFGLNTIETPFFTIPFFPSSVRSSDILFFAKDFWGTLKQNFLCAFRIIIQQGNDALCNMVPGFGTLYRFSVIFLPVGLVSAIIRARKNDGAAFLLVFLLTALWEGLITSGVNVNRFNIVFYPLIILTGLGVYEIVSRIRFLWAPVAATFLISFALFANTYFTDYARDISQTFMKDFGCAVSSLKETDAEKIYITSDSQFPGASYVSEILTLYYMDIDAEYFQGKTSSNGDKGPAVPYQSRFVYKRISADDLRPEESCAYVITSEERASIEAENASLLEYYSAAVFGKYYVLTYG